MVALTSQFRLGISPTYHQAEEFPPPSLQSPTADIDNPDSDSRHCYSTSPDAMEDLRSLTTKETKERKTCRDEVAEVDLRIAMD